MSSRAALFCLIVVCSIARAQELAPRWDLIELGGYEGASSNAFSINDLDFVAGRANDRASLWLSGRRVELPHPSTTTTYSEAWDVNRVGLVAGSSYDVSIGRQRATLWTASASAVVGTLPGGTESFAHAINDQHLYVGASATAGTAIEHAYVGYFVHLFDLHRLVPWAGLTSVAWDINNAGQVVGTVVDQSFDSHAVLWNLGGDVVDLGTLGGQQGTARGINEGGDVVGGSETQTGETHAFLSKCIPPATREMIDLGALAPGMISEGLGVNAAREVVGWSQVQTKTGIVSAAIYWSESTGMIDLNSLVAHPDWQLVLANDINVRGDVVGYGWYVPIGSYRAFVLRRSEP